MGVNQSGRVKGQLGRNKQDLIDGISQSKLEQENFKDTVQGLRLMIKGFTDLTNGYMKLWNVGTLNENDEARDLVIDLSKKITEVDKAISVLGTFIADVEQKID